MTKDDNVENDCESDNDSKSDDVLTKAKVVCTKSKYTCYHLSVFLLTFFSYAFFHICRKTFSNVKSTMVEAWTCDSNATFVGDIASYNRWCETSFCSNKAECETFLGTLDTVFLGCYAIGLYLSGMLGDRFNPRIVLSIGMWLAAILLFFFGYVTEKARYYNTWLYVVLWGAQGFVQASGWPTEVCVMGSWFGKSSRGLLFGIWSACASVGNIIGTLIVAEVLPYGYEYAFLANASILFCGGVVVFFGLVSSPREVGLPDADDDDLPESEESSLESERVLLSERPKAISFFRAVMLPGVISYSLAYACLKLVNYSFFFWLPYYLQNNFGWSNEVSDELSTWYDWGGIVGGILSGVITDLMGCRAPAMSFMLLASMAALLGYSKSPKDKLINSILMGVAGFFIGGPANLISSAVSADLGRAPEIRGNAEALSTVTGIMDGTGSVGAALGQILVPLIENWFDWTFVFYLFIFMTFMTAVCIIPATYHELRELIQKARYHYARWLTGEVSLRQICCGHSCCGIPFGAESSGGAHHHHGSAAKSSHRYSRLPTTDQATIQ